MLCKHGIVNNGYLCLVCESNFKETGHLSAEGQLKIGNKIKIVGKSRTDSQIATVRDVIQVNDKEEVIIDIKRNRFFSTSIFLKGQSWAKQIQLIEHK